MNVKQQKFAEWDGQIVNKYTIANSSGMTFSCIDYGCIITDISVPDVHQNSENIVLGFDTLEEYVEHSPYFGSVVGRVAGRIKEGQFELDGKTYVLPKNEGENHLHGGMKGFSHVVWNSEIVQNEEEAGVRFTYTSPDGEEGYPGTVTVSVTYLLNNQNELKIICDGQSDQETLLNLTNHSYFNLSGNLKRDVLDHALTLKSKQLLELDQKLLPTGKMLDVENTPFDFRSGRKLRDGVGSTHPQNVLAGNGYDHPFLLDASFDREIVLDDEESGRRLVVETDQPCVVVYSGNQLKEDGFLIRGKASKKYLGVCLETQGLPDAIHHDHFPSVILEGDKIYHAETKWTFLTIPSK